MSGVAGALMMGILGEMMDHDHPLAGHAPWITSAGATGTTWGLGLGGIVGGLVLFAAYRIQANPRDANLARTLSILGGALSLFAMGGSG